MQSLRSALGKQGPADVSATLSPKKLLNKTKNTTIWALDQQQQLEKQHHQTNISTKLESMLSSSFKKDATFSELVFYQIVEQLQNGSQMEELQCLLMIQNKTHELEEQSDTNFKGNDDYTIEYLSQFQDCLIKRIKKLKKKEKKIELIEYEKIQNNFKKKTPLFINEEDKYEKNPAKFRAADLNDVEGKSQADGSSKKNGSSSSTEGKLGKLLSNSKLKDERKLENNLEMPEQHQESISFSAVVSQSMAVRQRRPKEQKKEKKEKQPKESVNKKEEGTAEKDEAFIFYRPKAGRRK